MHIEHVLSDPLGPSESTGFNSFAADPVVTENWQAISNAGYALWCSLTPYLLANTHELARLTGAMLLRGATGKQRTDADGCQRVGLSSHRSS